MIRLPPGREVASSAVRRAPWSTLTAGSSRESVSHSKLNTDPSCLGKEKYLTDDPLDTYRP